MRKISILFLVLLTTALYASNVITYTATSKLPNAIYLDDSGFRADAFNVAISDHTFIEGQGTITFIGEVTNIGYRAFYNCSSLSSITIPNSVTHIGYMAISWCSSLNSITLPNSVTYIGEGAFAGCSSISTIHIPNSVTYIGAEAFAGCSSISTIHIPNSVTYIGRMAFEHCTSLPVENNLRYADTYLVEAVDKSLPTYTIKSGTKWIEEKAFFNCSSLSSITIPNSVTNIGDWAFCGCSSLPVENNIRYADTYLVEVIDESLSSYIIRPGTKWIGSAAFQYCSSLNSITIPNSVIGIEYEAFRECTSLSTITIPNSVTSIGEGAFSGCSSLRSIDIPNSVTSIEHAAFTSCSSITSITIPNSVTSIGDGAFFGCHSLNSITCYATTPPTCEYQCFLFVNESIPVYVPANSITMYQTAAYWEYFTNFQAISAEPTTNPVSTVVTTPSDNSVTIIWPAITGANTYTIEVKMNGVTVCTLTFNAQGQLTNISFAPGRGMNNAVEAATAVAGGYRFTVTSLNPGTNYTYEVEAQDVGGTSIASHTGSFTTTGGTPTAIDQTSFPLGEDRGEAGKIIRDGQLYILRDGKTYNAQGGEL